METAPTFTSKHSMGECEPHVKVRCGDRAKVDWRTVDSRAHTRTHVPHFPKAQRRSKLRSLQQLPRNECAPNSYQALSLQPHNPLPKFTPPSSSPWKLHERLSVAVNPYPELRGPLPGLWSRPQTNTPESGESKGTPILVGHTHKGALLYIRKEVNITEHLPRKDM